MTRIALVTGTSTGIGLSAAVLLAKAGFTVVATMRNLDKRGLLDDRAAAEGVTLDVRPMDVTDDASVAACVADVLAAHGKIDVLVNNAGAGYLGSLEQTSLDAARETFEVNFFGVWRVTQAVFPAMRAAGAGRIISISSIGGLIGQPFNDAYCAAKFAVEGLMESLAPVAQRLGIHVSLVEPGPVSTEFVSTVRAKREVGEIPMPAGYAAMVQAYMASITQSFTSMAQSADDIGHVIVEAATAETPHFRYLTSEFVTGVAARKYVDTTGDSVVALSGARLQ